jgi:hypothetical protein
MLYLVRGPTHEIPAEIETLDSFVRPYPADRTPMNTSIALDEDTPTPLTSGEASDEEIMARGGPSTTKPQQMLSSGLYCSARIPRSAPPPAHGMSAYDSMDADPKSATVTPRGSSAELPPSLVSRMQAAGQLLCWSITHGRIIRRLREVMLRSRRRCWCLRSRASGRMRGGLGRTKRRYGTSWRTRRTELAICAPAFSVPS